MRRASVLSSRLHCASVCCVSGRACVCLSTSVDNPPQLLPIKLVAFKNQTCSQLLPKKLVAFQKSNLVSVCLVLHCPTCRARSVRASSGILFVRMLAPLRVVGYPLRPNARAGARRRVTLSLLVRMANARGVAPLRVVGYPLPSPWSVAVRLVGYSRLPDARATTRRQVVSSGCSRHCASSGCLFRMPAPVRVVG